MNDYKVHFAADLARAGKTVEFGIWDKVAASYGHGVRINPAQCRNRARRIDYTTIPANVTCAKCAVPADK